MTTQDALNRLKTILGRDLYPAAVPRVRETLEALESDSYRRGFAAGSRGRRPPSELNDSGRDRLPAPGCHLGWTE